MFKWKRKHEGNRFEYTLVVDGDVDHGDEEVIGRVVVTEDIGSCDITVTAECKKIGYEVKQEQVDKNSVEIMVRDRKRFIKEECEKIESLR